MKKSLYKFQSKEFSFPKWAYVACIAFKLNGGKIHHACLTRVFENPEMLKRYVIFVLNDFSSEEDGIVPSYKGYLIKIKLDRKIPLTKKYWRKDSSFDKVFLRKFRNDVNIIKYWQMSEILVTPDGEIDGIEFFSFSLSIFKNSPVKDIELFIKNSGHVVDIRAKSAAFYSLKRPVKTDWLSGTRQTHELPTVERYIN